MTPAELRAKYPNLSNFDDAEIAAMYGDGELEVELDDPEGGGQGGMGDTGSGLKGATKLVNAFKGSGSKASAPGGSGNIGSGIAGNNAAQDGGYETMDHANYSDVSATIDDAGGAEATNPDSGSGDSGGSWIGAVMGAIAGYKQGQENTEEDPAMTSGEDGYGKYHHDARAEIGGGTLGGVMGYYSNGATTGVTGPIVKWIHPYMQDMTRDVMNVGDKAGDAYGSMSVDPIGTMASGKYSWSEIAKSGIAGPLARYWK